MGLTPKPTPRAAPGKAPVKMKLSKEQIDTGVADLRSWGIEGILLATAVGCLRNDDWFLNHDGTDDAYLGVKLYLDRKIGQQGSATPYPLGFLAASFVAYGYEHSENIIALCNKSSDVRHRAVQVFMDQLTRHSLSSRAAATGAHSSDEATTQPNICDALATAEVTLDALEKAKTDIKTLATLLRVHQEVVGQRDTLLTANADLVRQRDNFSTLSGDLTRKCGDLETEKGTLAKDAEDYRRTATDRFVQLHKDRAALATEAFKQKIRIGALEVDVKIAGRDALDLRDQAVKERDLAILKRDLAILKRDQAIQERDLATKAIEQSMKDKNEAMQNMVQNISMAQKYLAKGFNSNYKRPADKDAEKPVKMAKH